MEKDAAALLEQIFGITIFRKIKASKIEMKNQHLRIHLELKDGIQLELKDGIQLEPKDGIQLEPKE